MEYDYFDMDLANAKIERIVESILEAEEEKNEISAWLQEAKQELRTRTKGKGRTIYNGRRGSLAVTSQENRWLPDPKFSCWGELKRELGAEEFSRWFTCRVIYNLTPGAGPRLSEAPKSVRKALKLHSRDARIGCRINKD